MLRREGQRDQLRLQVEFLGHCCRILFLFLFFVRVSDGVLRRVPHLARASALSDSDRQAVFVFVLVVEIARRLVLVVGLYLVMDAVHAVVQTRVVRLKFQVPVRAVSVLQGHLDPLLRRRGYLLLVIGQFHLENRLVEEMLLGVLLLSLRAFNRLLQLCPRF